MSQTVGRGRRKTTLPDEPKQSTLAIVSNVLKDSYDERILHQINEQSSAFWKAFLEPDPWDEAVRWLERRHAPESVVFEWDWPAR